MICFIGWFGMGVLGCSYDIIAGLLAFMEGWLLILGQLVTNLH